MSTTSTRNALHFIAHAHGPYWAAAVANTLSRRKGIKSFHYPLIVRPNGDVCGAASSYQTGTGDLPSFDRGQRLPACV
jgi:hypothetical protein